MAFRSLENNLGLIRLICTCGPVLTQVEKKKRLGPVLVAQRSMRTKLTRRWRKCGQAVSLDKVKTESRGHKVGGGGMA